MPRLRANWAQRVPALALGAAVLPHRSSGPARLASMRPVERVPELQGAAIFLKGLAGLPAPVLARAGEVLRLLEAGHHVAQQLPPRPPDVQPLELGQQRMGLDVDALSPLEALIRLAAWKKQLAVDP